MLIFAAAVLALSLSGAQVAQPSIGLPRILVQHVIDEPTREDDVILRAKRAMETSEAAADAIRRIFHASSINILRVADAPDLWQELSPPIDGSHAKIAALQREVESNSLLFYALKVDGIDPGDVIGLDIDEAGVTIFVLPSYRTHHAR